MRFHCPLPSCSRSFQRKEHLNRHQRNHDLVRAHECFICCRRFARRDILDRHLPVHHAASKRPKRTHVACQTCRQRKSKCDTGDPCSMCSHLRVPCVRLRSSVQFTATTGVLLHAATPQLGDEDPGPVGLPDHGVDDSLVCGEDSDNTSVPTPQDGREGVLLEDSGGLNGDMLDWTPTNNWMSDVRVLQPELLLPEVNGTMPPFDEALLELPPFIEQGDNQCGRALPTTPPDSITNARPSSLPETMFHEAWSILHHSTVEREDQYPLLSRAMGLLARPSQRTSERTGLMKELMTHLVAAPEVLSSAPAETFRALQALVVVLISFILEDMAPATAQWAAQGTDVVISTMRRSGMFSRRWTPPDTMREHRWTCEEENKRMAYAVLRLDVYFSVITHRPPSLRFEELRLTLPVTETLWKASATEDRHHLQWFEPAGRDRCSFGSAVKDFQQPGCRVAVDHQRQPFGRADSHLVLCALQAEICPVAQAVQGDTRFGDMGFLPSTQSPDTVGLWRSHLLDCQTYLEHAYRRGQMCFADSPEPQHFWHTLNLTLYHLTLLNLHADISLLEQQQHCCDSRQETDIQTAIRRWISSTNGRRAVYHAVQLQQKYECEECAAWPEYYNHWNPLRSTALLFSGIVLCAYSAEYAATPLENNSIVELYCEDDMSAEPIQPWIQEGGCACIRGTVLGRPALARLVPWCRERLVTFPASSRRFGGFLSRIGDY